MAELYWIDLAAPFRLAIMARPRAGDWLDDEIERWRQAGVQIVVSLLEASEVSELGLGREAGACKLLGMEFISFPIPDRSVPASRVKAVELAGYLVTRLREGLPVAIHCRAGIGRSALLAAQMLNF